MKDINIIGGKIFLSGKDKSEFVEVGRLKTDNHIKSSDDLIDSSFNLDRIYAQLDKIQGEQDRLLVTEYLKDKAIIVGTPLVKAMVENDERFKDCKVFYHRYADPNSLFIIRRVSLGILEEA